jgi:predicted RNA polymerase sigma factor
MDQNVSSPGTVSQMVEHLFRHEAAKMVATLTRIFGLEHLTLAEDVVQATLARALWFDARFSHSQGRVSWPYPSKA